MVNANEEHIIKTLAELEKDVSYLKERDTQLNGTIQKVDNKVDGLTKWIMTQTAGIALALLILLYQVSK